MSGSSNNIKQLDHHHEYYIQGGDLYIVVAHTIFRVHSYFFRRESQRFRDIMDAPVAVGQVHKGGADYSAIVVKEVSVEHFSKFLWVFYNPKYTVYTATLPEWIAILKLAHEYQFPEVKRLVIHKLKDFDIQIAERIVLYQDHAVDPVYLVPLYVKLCMRDEGPTDDETGIMGMKTSLIIFRARERLRFRPLAGPGGINVSSPPDENDITRTIYSLLGFDYGQTGSVTHRPTTDVPTRMRRVALRRRSVDPTCEPSNFGQDMVMPEKERMLGDAEENVIIAKEDCRHMEIGQKELIVIEAREVESTTLRCGFSLVNSIHGRAGAVAIFVVIPARTFLLLFALSWTFLIFCMIRDFPSGLRIL